MYFVGCGQIGDPSLQNDHGSGWLRACAQPTTYLGVVMLAVIFSAVLYLRALHQHNAQQSATREAENLVRIFELSISRAFRHADASIVHLRSVYQNDPKNTPLNAWTSAGHLKDELPFQISVTDAQGVIIDSTVTSAVGLAIGDLEHFQVHAGTKDDRLFISKPVNLRMSGRLSIILTRPLKNPDGSFNGILSAMIDVAALEKFYKSINLGQDGFVSLMGLDGVIRARGGNGQSRWDLVGKHFPNAGVLRAVARSDQGIYWTDTGARATGVEDVRRLLSYRKVDGFPLVATVGIAEQEVFKLARANANSYWLIAGILTAGILVAMGFGVARERKLAATSSSLARSNMWLETAIENMPHGLCLFDAGGRLVLCNRRYSELYDLAPEQTRPGTTLYDILKARVAAGSYPSDADEYIKSRMAHAFSWEGGEIIDELRNGRVLSISRRAMPDGGSVAFTRTSRCRSAPSRGSCIWHCMTASPILRTARSCMSMSSTR
jgi:PAS domain-containing protein